MKLQLLIVLSCLFPATHLLLSHGTLRSGLVRVLGEWPFRGLYSLISLATLGGASYLYWGNRHMGAVLWDLPDRLELAVAVPLMLLAVFLVVHAFATPSPASMAPVRPVPRGVLHITRHPMNMGFACFGIAHMVANGNLGDLFYFGAWAVLGLAGPFHLDRRKLRELGEPFQRFLEKTSVLPFVALLQGRARPGRGDLRVIPMLVAAIVFVALLLLHGSLFGPHLLAG